MQDEVASRPHHVPYRPSTPRLACFQAAFRRSVWLWPHLTGRRLSLRHGALFYQDPAAMDNQPASKGFPWAEHDSCHAGPRAR